MTYVIAEPCVDTMDQACVAVCPVDCIHFEQGVDRTLYIDPNECIDCGACEPECPVNAIFPEESLPAEWAEYTKINAVWFTDKDAARAMVEAAQARLSRTPAPDGRRPHRIARPAADPGRPVVPSPARGPPRCASSRSSPPPRRSSGPSGSRTTSWGSRTPATTRRVSPGDRS